MSEKKVIYKLGDSFVKVDSSAYVKIPFEWFVNLSGDELKKMCLLKWRYTFYLAAAIEKGEGDLDKVFFESQEKLCKLFGMSPKSRKIVGKFLQRMESLGYISIKREMYFQDGIPKPKHYIVVHEETTNRGEEE